MSSSNFITVVRSEITKVIEAEKERFASGKLNPKNIDRATGYVLGLEAALEIIIKVLSRLN